MSGKSRKFNIIELDLLESYLRYYHFAANRACFPPQTSNNSFDSDDDETIRISNRQATVFENEITHIGGHKFPALERHILEQPYLALPSTLGIRERRTIYSLCVHVGLYHTAAGPKFEDRYTVLSVHPDGFDHVPNLEEPLSFPVIQCKPWFHRNDIAVCPTPRGSLQSTFSFSPHFLSRHKVRESTRKNRGVIEDLMAYPYQCLREHDVEGVEGGPVDSVEDLSNPPQFINSNSVDGPILVDTGDKMTQCVETLNNSQITELAFDVEAYNANRYKQATCLLQLTTNLYQEYVIDVLAPGVWDKVSSLKNIFANKDIVKVGHAISGIDVPCLHRDFGIFIVNAFDTQEAATKLGLKNQLSLIKLCRYYKLGLDERDEENDKHLKLKELYQNCDWRQRPLLNDQVEYGILDVRYLIHLRRLLIKDVLDFDSVSNPPRNLVTRSNLNIDSEDRVSPLKLEREASTMTALTNDNSVRGIDSLDVALTADETDNDSAKSSDSNNNSDNDNDNDNDNEKENDGGEKDAARQERGTGDGDGSGSNGLSRRGSEDDDIVDFKNGFDDASSFFSAHDDMENRSLSTLGSKVSELRYNQTLMDVLKVSQQKCLSLWTPKSERADKNDDLLAMKQRANRLSNSLNAKDRDKKVWSKEDDWLYQELVEWREDAAKKIGVMPSMLCNLNFLVLVAYRRPISLISLRRLSYFLPTVFCDEEHLHHLEDLFSVVAGAGEVALVNADAIVRLYSERLVKSKLGDVKERSFKEDASMADTGGTGGKSDTTDGSDKPLKAIVLDRCEDEDVSLMSADIQQGDKRNTLKKMYAAAAVASLAVIGLGIMKRKR